MCIKLGVILQALPVDPISEFSTMTRDLCVRLVTARQGLERTVIVDIQFSNSAYATQSKLESGYFKAFSIVTFNFT